MRTHLLIIAVSITIVAATGMSCQSSSTDARRAVARELRERQQKAAESEKLCAKGQRCYQDGKSLEAVALLQQAVTVDPSNARAWMLMGTIEFEQEHFYEAAEAFHQASRLVPSRFEPYFNLGTVLESTGRYAEAIDAYEMALELSPEQVEVMENLARTLVRAQMKPQRARELMNRALLAENRPQWRQWLQMQLLRLDDGIQGETPLGVAPEHK